MSNQVKTDILRIVDEGERWLRHLTRQRTLQAIENWIITLLLYGLLIISAYATLGTVPEGLLMLGALLAILFAIISLFFFLKRRRTGELEKWRKHMAELRQRESAPVTSLDEIPKAPYKGALESALELMDQMAVWAREIAESRIGWAWSYGVLAFLLAQIVIMYLLTRLAPNLSPMSFPSSIVVGLLVWYILKKRRKNEAERRTRMVEEWRNRLEREREEFLRSL